MALEDLAEHHTRKQEPISTSYRGLTVYEVPPPTHVSSPGVVGGIHGLRPYDMSQGLSPSIRQCGWPQPGQSGMQAQKQCKMLSN